jgi:hypothetical protein
MGNISLEELDQAKNLLLDVYNILGGIPVNDLGTYKYKVLVVINEIETFLEKMGVNLTY